MFCTRILTKVLKTVCYDLALPHVNINGGPDELLEGHPDGVLHGDGLLEVDLQPIHRRAICLKIHQE